MFDANAEPPTREVLREHGYSDAEIDELAGDGDVIVMQV